MRHRPHLHPHVLALLTELEPAQADLLERIVDGPLIAAGTLGA